MIYFNGLLLGLSLIMSLGPQNVFLIRQGVKRKHVILSAFTCFFSDIILVYASVVGLQNILQKHSSIQVYLVILGALFLIYYGVSTLRGALMGKKPPASTETAHPSRQQIILLALGFSLLNPHAIIDSVVIIGSGSSQFPEHQFLFLLGVITSSLLWFSSLTWTTYYFANVLAKQRVWQSIEIASGCLMVFLSAKLLLTLL